MNLGSVHTVYFLGIGGIGMSALARYFLAQNVRVIGYDKTKTTLTDALQQEGAHIHFTENVSGLTDLINDEGVLFCYTPAIPEAHSELDLLRRNKVNLYKRSEVLGLITQNYFTIAIAGTHGKTTTSSMVAHILNESGVSCVAFLGGISLNFNSNMVLNDDADVIVVEADEYDRSFLTLAPNIALVTSLDADHLDIYGDDNHMQEAYCAFVDKIRTNGSLIVKAAYKDALSQRTDIDIQTYSLTNSADIKAHELHVADGAYHTHIVASGETTKDVELGLPGIHNVENAVGAFAIAQKMGIDGEKIKQALKSYKGVKRRFEYHIKTANLVYIDDYAHHPSELNMCIASVRELYPNKKITGIFQPHLYSRTRDFMDDFAASLGQLDELILLDIYPAREEPIAGVTSQALLEKVILSQKTVASLQDAMAIIETKKFEVLLTMGAGDIDTLVEPIKKELEVRNA